ncbi:MAG: tRNA (adenosine(37)-N6)-threonylcarbamoyltransferase complex ATPase subunit type 1 TsaE [Calditrichia bacterium]|nr:tRNA (adenosine(37)-N6)-threonylcarbamoyltransferase complex ATPase subunit type 1 TsaE [Calditrichia bacterium]
MKKKILVENEVMDLDGTRNFARETVKYFHGGDTILLYGELGSGKTFITRDFVALLGSKAEVSSPSFSLINQYDGVPLINHIDLYRVKDETDLINLGLEDLWNSTSINFIEWPEIIEDQISWPHYRINIEIDLKKSKWRKFRLFEFYE